MTCLNSTDGKLWVCTVSYTAKRAHYRVCLDCGKRAISRGFFQAWYGWHDTCMNCGRMWDDGEWLTLEFERGVRRSNIDAAKKTWRQMPPISKNHWGRDM